MQAKEIRTSPPDPAVSMSRPLVSILINNYNYARYLGEAIDSALNQSYFPFEVVIVDDGSTDHSRELIGRYGDKVVALFKENGGQASAFNAGIAASKGEILCFLDADDFFYESKTARVADTFLKYGHPSVPMLVCHPLLMVDGEGRESSRTIGNSRSYPLNLYAYAKKYKYMYLAGSPTSGMACNRALANLLFPLPEKGIQTSADAFVNYAASLLCDVVCENGILGAYRVHGKNLWHASPQRLTDEFLAILQNFLNTKLVQNGRLPVISYGDSMYAWRDLVLDHRWGELVWHMVRLSARQRDLHTARISYETMVMAIRELSKMARSK
jgi:glycosyltransferase involved in cell wall biosynthesis